MSSNADILKGMSFNSSLSDIDASVSPQEYKERLLSLLQPILDLRFPGNPGKQRIRIYKDRINFACPYCGDSAHSNHKKRANLILRGKFAQFFKCHNCGESRRIDNFFQDFNKSFDLDMINYMSSGIQDFSQEADFKYDVSLFFDIATVDKYAIDRGEFLKSFGLVEVKNTPVWGWLKNRAQYDESKFMYNPTKNYLIILNLTPSGKVLGVQKRNFKGYNKYLTYKLSKLYELLKKDTKDLPEWIDDISQIFNICLVNYARPITLFEGPLDSFLFKNSIAMTGIHKHFPIDIPMRYWFDDDNDGRKKSIEYINMGHEVFLWTKLRQTLELPIRKKWDLNDLIVWLRNNKIKVPIFNQFFSQDTLDIIDI